MDSVAHLGKLSACQSCTCPPSRMCPSPALPRWRRAKLTRKFYAPKRYVVTEGYPKPPPLAKTLGGWVPQVRGEMPNGTALTTDSAGLPLAAVLFSAHNLQHQMPLPCSTSHLPPQVLKMSEAEVIRCAGLDAAMYLKILRMGGCRGRVVRLARLHAGVSEQQAPHLQGQLPMPRGAEAGAPNLPTYLGLSCPHNVWDRGRPAITSGAAL